MLWESDAATGQLIAESDVFRRIVFSAYYRRITDLFFIIEEVAFQRMYIRLAHKILELPGENDTLRKTHQQLALDLGSVREVISRYLAEWERMGWVHASRGMIEGERAVG